jgi:hypothetical protein
VPGGDIPGQGGGTLTGFVVLMGQHGDQAQRFGHRHCQTRAPLTVVMDLFQLTAT